MADAPMTNGATGPVLNIVDQFGSRIPATSDPAFQPPGDPLVDLSNTIARARRIDREIPNVVVEQGWTVQRVRESLGSLVVGLFDLPAQLQDAIASDSRVQSAMRQRSGGLLGQPLSFRPPKRFAKDPLAKKCCRR